MTSHESIGTALPLGYLHSRAGASLPTGNEPAQRMRRPFPEGDYIGASKTDDKFPSEKGAMTDHKARALELAISNGFTKIRPGPFVSDDVYDCFGANLEAFYMAARADGIRAAAKVCRDLFAFDMYDPGESSAVAILKLLEPKP